MSVTVARLATSIIGKLLEFILNACIYIYSNFALQYKVELNINIQDPVWHINQQNSSNEDGCGAFHLIDIIK